MCQSQEEPGREEKKRKREKRRKKEEGWQPTIAHTAKNCLEAQDMELPLQDKEVQQAQQAAPTGTVGATTQWGHSLIETRACGRLRTFSGNEEDWATWSFVARSDLDLLSVGFRELLVSAEAAGQATEIRQADMSDMARTHSWTLFNVLTQSAEGRALSVIMNSEASNGLQAWRMPIDAYEPRVGGRYTAMLMGIIGPQWGHVKEANFLESLDT